jgi:hypothetical protein
VKEITKLLLLEELLGQVLKVSLGEGKLGGDVKLRLVSGDGHLGAEVTCEDDTYTEERGDTVSTHSLSWRVKKEKVRYLISTLTGLAVDLNAIMQELLEGDGVKDLVFHRLPTVNGELGEVLLLRLLVSFLQVTKHRVVNSKGSGPYILLGLHLRVGAREKLWTLLCQAPARLATNLNRQRKNSVLVQTQRVNLDREVTLPGKTQETT